jgi:hypothetical protein
VQREKVARPALMRSVSVGVNSRAPLRISTLFWSFMFFSFHHLDPLERAPSSIKRSDKPFWTRAIRPKLVALPTRHLIQDVGVFQQTGPHSPIEASPSLLGQAEVGTVQTVSVCIPPPTRAISSSLNERAPLRTNTLFWSSILFFPFIFRPKQRPKPFKNSFPLFSSSFDRCKRPKLSLEPCLGRKGLAAATTRPVNHPHPCH